MIVTINIPSQLPALTGNANLFLRVNAGANGIEWAAAGGGITIGTTAITSGTVGRVLFEGAGNVVQQSSNFFWDNTNSRLGIRAPAPTASLEVLGAAASGTTQSFAVHNSTGNNNALIVTNDTRVGIGTNAPDQRLHVSGSGSERIRLTGAGGNVDIYSQATNNRGIFLGANCLLRNLGGSAQSLSLVGLGTGTFDTNFSVSGDGSGNGRVRLTTRQGGNNSASVQIERAGITEIYLISNNSDDSYFNTTRSFVFGGTARSSASAQVEMISTTQGFLPPRMTTAQRDLIGTPAAGLVIYNTTTNKLNVYTTAWEAVTSL